MTPPRKKRLLLLPGLICDETVWRPQLDGLSSLADMAVVSYADCTSIPAMAARVLEMAPPTFALAGHSMGGRVAMEVISQLAERGETRRVTGLALIDSAASPVAEGEAAKRQALVERCRAEGMEALVRDWLPPMVHPDRLEDDALMAPLRAMVRRHTPDQFAGQVQALLTTHLGVSCTW